MPITIHSRFTPLTYDEITKPLLEQTKAQEDLENMYMEASDKAAQVMAQANQQTDRQSYLKLKQYSEDLQSQADALLHNGLASGSRQALLNMRRRYNQDIIPIQTAATRRQELAEEQRKLMVSNPDMLFERDANTLSLDDLVRNPQLNYGSTINKSDISKKAAAITEAIGKGRQQVSLGQNLDRYTKQILVQSGLTQDEIQAALNGDNSVLDRALNSLYTSTGVDSWGNQTASQAVRAAIREGATLGAGSLQVQASQDHSAIRADQLADRNNQMNLQAAMYGLKPDGNGGWTYDPTNPGPRSSSSTTRVRTATGEVVDIEAAGKKSKDYGTVYLGADGIYYQKNGSTYTPIANQADAKKAYESGTPTASVTPAAQAKRDNFDNNVGNNGVLVISAGGKSNYSVSDRGSLYDYIMSEGADATLIPTESRSGYMEDIIEEANELIKDSGRHLDDYYIVYTTHRRNRYILIPKDKADIEFMNKFGIEGDIMDAGGY